VVGVEQWAETRRLHFVGKLSQREIHRRDASAATIRVPSVGFALATASTTRSTESNGRRCPLGGRRGRR
jgi:hypothetical protein